MRSGGYFAKLISTNDGRRTNAAHNYLYQRGHCTSASSSKIRITTRRTVVRVLLNDEHASGLEVCDTSDPAQREKITARRMVLVCGGALGTPIILERSGIGDREILDSLGIPVVADLPGVGREYQDHQVYPFPSALLP